jgi:hypothetical protein
MDTLLKFINVGTWNEAVLYFNLGEVILLKLAAGEYFLKRAIPLMCTGLGNQLLIGSRGVTCLVKYMKSHNSEKGTH